jgi:CxxC motif-containing protein (DUF1111 family)
MRQLTLAAVCAMAALSFSVTAHAACGDGVIDAGEQCDDGITPSPCCTDTCRFAQDFVCRSASGPCDLPEVCTGFSDECPADAGPTDEDGDGVCDALDTCPFVANPEQENEACLPKPLKKLTNEEVARFDAGFAEFRDFKSIGDGLGPVFNGQACALCHDHPTSGGVSQRFVMRFGRYESGTFDPMTSAGGSLLQSKGIDDGMCAVEGEMVPAEATVSTRRITTPLFGGGLVEAIPDATILAYADPGDTDGDGISGRPNMSGGAIGRFGWKAQVATVHEFSADALLGEIGITNPDFPNESNPQGGPVVCDDVPDPEADGTAVAALDDFMVMLAPLKPTRVKGAGAGRGLFRKIGCAACHVGKMKTGDNPVRALHRQSVRLFSDLLLHDMGPALADGIEQGEATASEFRTAPLWGVGRRSLLLHDGRAATLLDAVMAHGGEAQTARDAFMALDADDRASLIAFLSSL